MQWMTLRSPTTDCRRIDRHYETTLQAHERFVYLSQIALLLTRLDRNQLFDTL
jgi:hypothetical protein